MKQYNADIEKGARALALHRYPEKYFPGEADALLRDHAWPRGAARDVIAAVLLDPSEEAVEAGSQAAFGWASPATRDQVRACLRAAGMKILGRDDRGRK